MSDDVPQAAGTDDGIHPSDPPGTRISPGTIFDAHAALETERDPRERAETAAGLVNEFISLEWPDAHGSAWLSFDVSDHAVYYGVTEEIDEPEVHELVSRQIPEGIALEPAAVEYSFAELGAAADVVRNQIADDPTLGVATRSAELLQGMAVGISTYRNAVAVIGPPLGDGPRDEGMSTTKSHRATAEDVFAHELSQSADGVPVIYIPGGSAKPTCSRSDCRFNMRAGLSIIAPALQPTRGNCTSAFSAEGGSGRKFMLTAGHCGSGVYRNGGAVYGGTDRNRFEESVKYDVQRVVRTNSSWSHSWYIFLGSNDFRRIDSTIPQSQIVAGTQVGMTGKASGTTRGFVKEIGVGIPELHGSPAVNVTATYCSKKGDSGAGVFRNNTAWGIHFNNNTYTSGPGTSCGQEHHRGYFLPIRRAASLMNVTIIHP